MYKVGRKFFWLLGDIAGVNRLRLPKIWSLNLTRKGRTAQINEEQQLKFFAAHPAVISAEVLHEDMVPPRPQYHTQGPWMKIKFRMPKAVVIECQVYEDMENHLYTRLGVIDHTIYVPLTDAAKEYLDFVYVELSDAIAYPAASEYNKSFFSPHGYVNGSSLFTPQFHTSDSDRPVGTMQLCCKGATDAMVFRVFRSEIKDPYSFFLCLYQACLQGNSPDYLMPAHVYDPHYAAYLSSEGAAKAQQSLIREDLKELNDKVSGALREAERALT